MVEALGLSSAQAKNFIVLAAFSYHFAAPALQKSYEELSCSDSFSGGGRGGLKLNPFIVKRL